MVFVDDPHFSHDTNRLTLPDGSVTEPLSEGAGLHYFYDSAKKYEEKYLPEMWKSVTPEILRQGHGGMDYFEFEVLADCLVNGNPSLEDGRRHRENPFTVLLRSRGEALPAGMCRKH